MIRRASTILLSTLAIYAFPASADCQSIGQSNPVLTWDTPDAAALGTRGRGFVQYGTGDNLGYTAQAGIGAWDGMFRAIYGHSYSQTLWGVGYARLLAAKDLGKLGTWGAGVDVGGAMDSRHQAAIASRGARLSIPLSVRWGSPSRLSIAPYVAPYGEIGRATLYQLTNCDQGLFCSWVPAGLYNTHALGMESGVQLTAWRLSLQIGLSDLPKREFGSSQFKIGAGVRLRF